MTVSVEKQAKILDLYLNGFKPGDIANALEIPFATVVTTLNYHGIKVTAQLTKNVLHRLSGAQIEGLAEDYQAGVSVAEICEKWHLNQATVWSALAELEIPTRGAGNRGTNKEFEVRVRRAIDLYQLGASLTAILRETGIYTQMLYKKMKERGVPTRKEITAGWSNQFGADILFAPDGKNPLKGNSNDPR